MAQNSHMVTLRITKSLKDSLKAAADASGRSLSGEVQYRLAEYAFNARVIAALTRSHGA